MYKHSTNVTSNWTINSTSVYCALTSYTILNLTKHGANKEPTKKVTTPTDIVEMALSNGDRKYIKNNIGNSVSKKKVNRPKIVVLYFAPHLSQ